MRFLLDTHTLLWFLMGDARLSDTALDLIQEAENEAFISIASLWEIAIKVSLGKLTLAQEFHELFPSQLEHNDFQILPAEPEHLSHLIGLPFHHKDPFDRLIICQAIHENLPIIGCDRVFSSYPIQLLW